MDSRSLNRRITLQQSGMVQDEIGQPTAGWVDFATVWADIKHLSGIEAIKSNAETSVTKASIRIRYRTDMTPGMRVLFGSTIYQITAVLPDEQSRDKTDLACEVVSG